MWEKKEKILVTIFSHFAYDVFLRIMWWNAKNTWEEYLLNSLLNDKILDLFKFIAHADHKINVTQNPKYDFGKLENILGKGENAGYQHFLPFQKGFQKPSFSRSLKVGIV